VTASFDGNMGVGATLYVGSTVIIRNVKIWQVALTDAQVAAL